MKIANIIGKVITVVFGLASLRWIAAMLGLMGMRFGEYDLPKVGMCLLITAVGVVIMKSTEKKTKR